MLKNGVTELHHTQITGDKFAVFKTGRIKYYFEEVAVCECTIAVFMDELIVKIIPLKRFMLE